MNVNQAAEQAWDIFVGGISTSEMMQGFDTPEKAIDAYCENWPWSDSNPDEEQAELMDYTPRHLLVVHLENCKGEWLADRVRKLIKTSDYVGGTDLADWIEEGDTDGMTPEQIAQEWDELPEMENDGR